jgi:uncharacterized membrane protein YccC
MSAAGKKMLKLSEHPRAARHIRAAKGWGGLLGFAIVAMLSWQAGVPPFEVGMRALLAGVAGYVVAWAGAVHAWRHLAVAEIRAAHRARVERTEAAIAAQRQPEKAKANA